MALKAELVQMSGLADSFARMLDFAKSQWALMACELGRVPDPRLAGQVLTDVRELASLPDRPFSARTRPLPSKEVETVIAKLLGLPDLNARVELPSGLDAMPENTALHPEESA